MTTTLFNDYLLVGFHKHSGVLQSFSSLLKAKQIYDNTSFNKETRQTHFLLLNSLAKYLCPTFSLLLNLNKFFCVSSLNEATLRQTFLELSHMMGEGESSDLWFFRKEVEGGDIEISNFSD